MPYGGDMMTQLINDLRQMVAIPSIGALAQHQLDVRRSADLVAALLIDIGCRDIQIVDKPYAPAIIARFEAPPGAPTICLYAHHDVQPIGEVSDWEYDPLEVTRVGDRLFGRGTADDKGGIAVHLETIRAFDGKPPIGVTIMIEGEEEIGSPHSAEFISDQLDQIKADAFVILDAGNWAVGQPAFTTTLRGICDVIIELETLDHAVHSGQFGGVAPDALTALCHLLASFHDEQGNVVVDGLQTLIHFDVDYTPESVFQAAGMLDGVKDLGCGSYTDRLWAKPALSVIGLDTVSVEQSSNTLLPTARARVSLRVPPGMDAARALDALVTHCYSHTPWGAHVKVIPGNLGNPGQVGADGPIVQAGLSAYQAAFGVPPVQMGLGGSIPLVNELQQVFPRAEFLLTGIADPDSRLHGPNESVDLQDLQRSVEAQIRLFQTIEPDANVS